MNMNNRTKDRRHVTVHLSHEHSSTLDQEEERPELWPLAWGINGCTWHVCVVCMWLSPFTIKWPHEAMQRCDLMVNNRGVQARDFVFLRTVSRSYVHSCRGRLLETKAGHTRWSRAVKWAQDGRWRAEWTEEKKQNKTQNTGTHEKGLYLAGADSSSLIGLDCERLYEHEWSTHT